MAYQTYHLLRKNYLLAKRNKCVTCLEIGWPILFCLLLYVLRLTILKTYYLQTSHYMSPYVITESAISGVNLKNCATNYRGGNVAIVPNNTLTRKIAARLPNGYKISYFNTNADLQNYITNPSYGTNNYNSICFAIVINNMTSMNYDYSLRFNTSLRTYEVPDTNGARTNFLVHQQQQTLYQYMYYGFITLQKFINEQIIKYQTNKNYTTASTSISSMQVEAYTKDPFSNVGSYLCIFFILPLIVAYLRMIYLIVKQKQDKIRELLLMMGTSHSAFYLSWLIRFASSYLIISICCMTIAQQLVFTNSNLVLLIIWYYLFCIALQFQGLFITVFFTNAKTSVVVGMILFIVNFTVIFLMQNNSNSSTLILLISSISPHNALNLASSILVSFQGSGIGINWNNINLFNNNYTFIYSIYSSCLNIVLFGLLFFYLDQVFPNEYGSKKKICFCLDFKCCHRKQNEQQQQLLQKEIKNQPQNNLQQISLKQNRCYIIKNLSKKFGDNQAVNNISMNLYQNEISVLLGHNGAGKTTTFSMLSGLLEPSSGMINVYGLDIIRDISQIRQILGVCPQQNVIFEQLTVREHLDLYYSLKLSTSNEIKQQKINNLINKIDLTQKVDCFAKDLSGGQKRKLCLANAFIGDNKILLLDEPTAGMDTTARRHIWQLLKIERDQKILILSTHFMDEADYLGDRIGIISKGELKCLDNSVKLKNIYGRGYSLSIVKLNSQVNSVNIIKFVEQSRIDMQISTNISNEITMKIKQQDIKKFTIFLENLEKNKQSLGIRNYGVSCTSLEQVFLNVIEHYTQIKQQKQIQMQDIDKQNKSPELEKENDQKDCKNQQIKSASCLLVIYGLFLRKVQILRRDLKQLVCQILLPTVVIFAGVIVMTINFNIPSPSIALDDTLYNDGAIVYYGAASTSINHLKSSINYININQLNTTSNTIGNWDNQIYLNKSPYVKGGVWLSDSYGQSYNSSYFVQCNTVSQDSCPYIINKVDNAIFQNLTNNLTAKITIRNAPLPQTASVQNIQSTAQGFIACLIFGMALSFIPSSIASSIVYQKQSGCKQQLLVSGVTLFQFWLSTFIFDILKYVIPCIAGPLLCYFFNISGLVTDVFYVTIILFILIGFSLIPFSYLFSFIFSDPGNAQVITFFTSLVMGITPVIFLILRIFGSTDVITIISYLSYIMRILPPFSFGYGILNIANRQLYAMVNNISLQAPLSYNIAFWDVVYLGIMSGVLWIGILIVEKLPMIRCCKQNSIQRNDTQLKIDQDVELQVKKVKQIIQSEIKIYDYTIIIDQLHKVFKLQNKNKVAVDSLSLTIQKGQIVGLLGVNGAGKSTTFKMLTGEEIQTSGSIYMAGFQIPSELSQAQKYMGYCSQIDSLYDNMTAKQHIQLYMRIKGIVGDRQLLIQKYLNLVGLKQYQNIISKKYSGGNKRKLCVLLAIIGNPQVILLDQPSAGMDPKAKRVMWDTISSISTLNKKSSILLTTHLMQEAEALSTKLGIMIQGRLKCLGSIQHIKSKYGKGYDVQIKLKQSESKTIKAMGENLRISESISYDSINPVLRFLQLGDIFDDVIKSPIAQKMKNIEINKFIFIEHALNIRKIKKLNAFILENFKSSSIVETYGTYVKYCIQNELISKIFNVLENNKEKLNINFYNVKQASLQQIFHSFAVQYYKKIGKQGQEFQE